ncbi:MAG: glycosyltransferase family 4 protein [Rhizobiaceae bacterium]|nr:glycosyltransferase family 4 protein [Rhizobiaceae bacterium]MCV0405593.1 glycosyltransferase family 4 protein [Rhizobiaceae bacterium]
MRIEKSDIEYLKDSGLFDAEWYIENYPAAAAIKIDPAEHFLRIGVRLKWNPSPRFDTAAYLAEHPDVERSGINPVLHFLRNGSVTDAKAPTEPSAGADADEGRSKAPVGSPGGTSSEFRTSRPRRNLTPDMQRLLQAAERSGAARRADATYDAIKSEFDPAYYLLRYPDIARAGIDPVRHFIDAGAREGRDPSPAFSTRYYLNRYPDIRDGKYNPFQHYVMHGRSEGRGSSPLTPASPAFGRYCEAFGLDPKRLEAELDRKRRDLRERLDGGVLGDMVRRAEKLEPLVGHAWLAAMNPGLSPIRSEQVLSQMAAIHQLQEQAARRRAKAIVMIPWCHVSGAARVAAHLATALAGIYGPDEVVVVRTETSEMQFPEWFPAGCRHVDLAGQVEGITAEGRQRLLVEFLRSLRPDVIFNVNSKLFWDALEPYGKALSHSARLYAYLFCSEKDIFGRWAGYPVRKFHLHFDLLDGVITDSHYLADELRNLFMVPPERADRLWTLSTPVANPPAPAPVPAAGRRRPQIFWAGRLDRQKRIDIVYALAERMKDVDFRMWGKPGLDKSSSRLQPPSNVTLEGTYKDFSELPLAECDLWLYTSEWDGVPNILIDVAAAAIPLVGSLAGGTGEVLKDGLTAPIRDIEDVSAYERAIRGVLSAPETARKRAADLRERVLSERTEAVYREALRQMLDRGSDQ